MRAPARTRWPGSRRPALQTLVAQPRDLGHEAVLPHPPDTSIQPGDEIGAIHVQTDQPGARMPERRLHGQCRAVRRAPLFDDFESTDHSSAVARVHPGCGFRIAHTQPLQERLDAVPIQLLLETFADHGVSRREVELVDDTGHVESGSADEDGVAAPA